MVSTETATPKKPRTKPTGPRNYVVKTDGGTWLLKADEFRVATIADIDLPRGKVVDEKAAQS